MKRAYLKRKHRNDKKESYRAKRIAATKAELAARTIRQEPSIDLAATWMEPLFPHPDPIEAFGRACARIAAERIGQHAQGSSY